MKNKPISEGKFYILCIDPGKLTGMCLFSFDSKETVELLWTKECNEYESDFLIENIAMQYQPHIEIVNEKFTVTERTAKLPDAPWSLEKTGVAKYIANKYQLRYFQQTPSAAKDFTSDKQLHAMKLWHVGGKGHANDALRHGILHLAKTYRYIHPNFQQDIDDEIEN